MGHDQQSSIVAVSLAWTVPSRSAVAKVYAFPSQCVFAVWLDIQLLELTWPWLFLMYCLRIPTLFLRAVLFRCLWWKQNLRIFTKARESIWSEHGSLQNIFTWIEDYLDEQPWLLLPGTPRMFRLCKASIVSKVFEEECKSCTRMKLPNYQQGTQYRGLVSFLGWEFEEILTNSRLYWTSLVTHFIPQAKVRVVRLAQFTDPNFIAPF